MYVGVLPEDEMSAKHLKWTVETMLRNELNLLRSRTQSPARVANQPYQDTDSEDEKEGLHLL